MMMGPNDHLIMLLGQRLTLARLAAFGAAGFIPALRAWRHTLPADCSRAALSDLRGHMLVLAVTLRHWLEQPHTPSGRAAEREAARLCAQWQSAAARLHPAFTPLFPLPADRAERDCDELGFPLGERAPWPKPRPQRSDIDPAGE